MVILDEPKSNLYCIKSPSIFDEVAVKQISYPKRRILTVFKQDKAKVLDP